MLYDKYERKMQRLAAIRDVILKFKVLIISVLSVIMALFAGFLTTRGIITEQVTVLSPEIVYGQTVNFTEAEALFRTPYYEYSKKGENNWSTTHPVMPGEYEIRAVTKRTFGIKDGGEAVPFTIVKKKTTVSVKSQTVQYGELPEIDVDGIISGDSVDNSVKEAFVFGNENVTLEKTSVEVKEGTVKIVNAFGEDVTKAYEFDYVSSQILITARPITVQTGSATFDYSGEKNFLEEAELADGFELLDGHELRCIEDTVGVTNMGDHENPVEVQIVAGELDVTQNYNITMVRGTLTIKPRPLTIRTESATKVYDGTPLNEKGFTQEGLLTNLEHEITLEQTTEATNVGEYNNEAISYSIKDKNGVDVTSNYEITVETGTLSVTKRPVKVYTDSNTWVYDGDAHTHAEIEKNENLVDTHTVSSNGKEVSEITNVGSIENKFPVIIKDGSGADVTDNYEVSYSYGTIEVTVRRLQVTTPSVEWVYDGTVHSCSNDNWEDWVIEGEYGLVKNHRLLPNEPATITDVGETQNVCKSVQVMDFSSGLTGNELYAYIEQLNKNYEVTIVNSGTLKVTPRPLTLTANTNEKVYDGTPLTDTGYAIQAFDELGFVGMVSDHNVNTNSLGSITDVGSVENVVSDTVIITDAQGKDVTRNYEIIREKGTLTVTQRPITILTNSATKVYDDTPLYTKEYQVTSPLSIVEGQTGEAESSTQITDVNDGQTLNEFFNFTITNAVGEDKTGNYNITIETGRLTVTQRPITVLSATNTWVYNDETFTDDGYTVVSEYKIVDGHTGTPSQVTEVKTVTAIGGAQNIFGSFEIYKEGERKTENYFISYEYGTLTVTPRPITVKTATATHVYTGTPLVKGEYESIGGDGLVSAHSLQVYESSKITEVGSIDNEFTSFAILNGSGDVKSNYAITFEKGTLSVTPRLIKIQTSTSSHVYDGTSYFDENYTVISELDIPYMQSGIATECAQITDVGEVSNTFTLVIKEGNDVVTENYIIEYVYGTLTVNPRPITVYTDDVTEYYDGEPLTSNKVSVTSTLKLVLDHRVTVNATGSITDVGSVDNPISTYSVLSGNEDVTRNYEVTKTSGMLTVIPRPVTVRTFDGEKEYDNTPLTRVGYEVTSVLGFVNNEILSVITSTAIVDVGTELNEFTEVKVVGLQGEDRTRNYEISYVTGTLTVTPYVINVTTEGATKVYDGLELRKDGAETDREPVQGHYIKWIVGNPSITDVGKETNTVTGGVFVIGTDEDKSHNYDFEYDFGTLTVTKRPLAMFTGSEVWEYDGQYHSKEEYGIVDGTTLAPNQVIDTVIGYPKILTVQKVSNQINDVKIVDQTGKDVTDNYQIDKQFGEIEITKRQITVLTGSDQKIYDGTPLTCQTYDVTSGSIVEGQVLVMTGSTEMLEYIAGGKTVNEFKGVSIVNTYDSNSNVTDQYDITYEYGTLEILKRAITVKALDWTNEYNGKPYVTKDIQYVEGWNDFVFEHTLSGTTDISPTDAGLYTVNITNVTVTHSRLRKDVTHCFDITCASGSLEITKRELIVRADDAEKPYDGTPLTCDTFTVDDNCLVEGHSIEVEITGSVIQGTEVNKIEWIKVFDQAGVEVTKNYEEQLINGVLSVLHRPITLRSKDVTKTYDGFPADNAHVSVSSDLGLMEGHQIKILSIVENLIDADNYENTFTATIVDGNGEDVSAFYLIEPEYGTVVILQREVEAETVTFETEYNGKPQSCGDNGVRILGTGLIAGHTVKGAKGVEHTDVGTYENEIGEFSIVDGNGADVTKNYKIVYTSIGNLVITPKKVTIKTENGEKVYDGKPLIKKGCEMVLGTSLVEGHEIVTSDEASITDVGSCENTFTASIVFDGKNVTSNYEIAYEYGVLTVTEREVAIKLTDVQRPFDGTPFTSSVYDIVDGSLTFADGQDVAVYTDGSQTEIGSCQNNVVAVTVTDKDGVDVTKNYIITHVGGTLTVTKGELSLKASSAEKEYDGTPLTDNGYQIVSGAIPQDFNLEVAVEGSITDYGSTSNVINSVIIKDSLGEDVTDMFEVTVQEGTLTVTYMTVIVKTGSDVVVYSGKPVTVTTYEFVGGKAFAQGHTLKVIESTQVVDATTGVDNVFTEYVIEDENGNDVGGNYTLKFSADCGKITVLPKELEVTSKSNIKVYDGTPLAADLTIETELLEGHTIESIEKARITDVGTTDNVITSYVIKDANGEDVSKNYDFVYIQPVGKLEVVARVIYVKTGSATKEYDGTPLKCESSSAINGSSLVEGDVIVGTEYVSITDVGRKNNEFKSVTIENALGEDKSGNYKIEYEYGTLEITPRSVTVKTGTDSSVYNGSPFRVTSFTVTEGNFIEGHEFNVYSSTELTDVGRVDNEFTNYEVLDEFGYNYTANYAITFEKGLVLVTPLSITVTSGEHQRQYDGTPFTHSEGEVVDGELVAFEQYLVIETSGAQTEVGTSENPITKVSVHTTGGRDITANYTITTQSGTLTVTQREVVLAPIYKEKIYDGTPLTSSECEAINGTSLVSGHTVEAVTDGSQTEPGAGENGIVSYKILNGQGEDVTANYLAITQKGKLLVRSMLIKLKVLTGSATSVYGEGELSCGTYTIIEGELENGHTVDSVESINVSDAGVWDNEFFSMKFVDSLGKDVSDCYSIEYVYGKLTVERRVIVINTHSATKEYDGTPLYCTDFDIVEGTLLDGHYAIGTSDYSQRTYVGTTENRCSNIVVCDELDTDVSLNYTVRINEAGTLEVTPKAITVKTQSKAKVYDGEPLYEDRVLAVNGEFVYGHSAFIVGYVSITDVGKVENSAVAEGIKVKDELENDVTDNYVITVESIGELEITNRGIIVAPEDAEKEYDGTPLVAYSYKFLSSGYLADGHYAEVTFAGSQTEVGASESSIASFVVFDQYGNDVTDNYTVGKGTGVLHVTNKKIIISTESANKLYDGTPLTATGYNFAFGSLSEGHQIEADGYASITEVGVIENSIETFIIVDAFGEDVTENYYVVFEFGTLEVVKAVVTFTAVDKSKVYDGTPLTSDEVEVQSDYTLPTGHRPVVVTEGSQTDVGESENVIVSIRIHDADGNDVTSLYTIKKESGKLQVTERYITVKLVDKSKIYDGTPLTSDEFEITSSQKLVEGHRMEVHGDGSQIDEGTSINNVDYYKIYSGDDDVTHNYHVTTEFGTLTVERPVLKITTETKIKEYDAKPYVGTYTVDGLRTVDRAEIILCEIPADIGTYTNKVESVTIYDENGDDVTYGYVIEIEEGAVTVEPREIKLRAYSSTKVYDGRALSVLENCWVPDKTDLYEGCKIASYQIIVVSDEDGVLTLIDKTGIVEPCNYFAYVIGVTIVDALGNDVSDKYDLQGHGAKSFEEFKELYSSDLLIANISVQKRKLTISSKTISLKYEEGAGSIVSTQEDFWISKGTLKRGHTIVYEEVRNELSEAGRITNAIGKITIYDENGNDVTDKYYNVDKKEGYLEFVEEEQEVPPTEE